VKTRIRRKSGVCSDTHPLHVASLTLRLATDCDADHTVGHKVRCFRCKRGKDHCIEITDQRLIGLFNETFRLRFAPIPVAETDAAKKAREDAFEHADEAFKQALRTYQAQRKKNVGDQSTPRSALAGAGGDGGFGVAKLENLQRTRDATETIAYQLTRLTNIFAAVRIRSS
jgi:hypothetical protein